MLFTWKLYPLQSSKFSFEYLLLPPRSAPTIAWGISLRLPFNATVASSYSWTLHSIAWVSRYIHSTLYSNSTSCSLTFMVEYRPRALVLSIFRADWFGRWVVTHSLADSNFHGHRPAVYMNQHLFWDLGERVLWRLNLAFGSSRIAKPAYPVWPTNDRHSTAGFN